MANEDAREPSSVTGRALGTAALIGVGVATGTGAFFGGKALLNGGAKVAGKVARNMSDDLGKAGMKGFKESEEALLKKTEQLKNAKLISSKDSKYSGGVLRNAPSQADEVAGNVANSIKVNPTGANKVNDIKEKAGELLSTAKEKGSAILNNGKETVANSTAGKKVSEAVERIKSKKNQPSASVNLSGNADADDAAVKQAMGSNGPIVLSRTFD